MRIVCTWYWLRICCVVEYQQNQTFFQYKQYFYFLSGFLSTRRRFYYKSRYFLILIFLHTYVENENYMTLITTYNILNQTFSVVFCVLFVQFVVEQRFDASNERKIYVFETSRCDLIIHNDSKTHHRITRMTKRIKLQIRRRFRRSTWCVHHEYINFDKFHTNVESQTKTM